RVESTASRISSTARSPAATSTPDRVYERRISATRRHRLLEHELAALAVVRDRLRVAAVEAGEAEAVIRELERREDAGDREVAQRIRADEVADLLHRHVRRDQLGLDLGVDAVEARVEDRRRADPDVDLGGARLPKQRHDLLGRGPADDRVVDDGQPLAADDLPQRVELQRYTAMPHGLRGLDERPA